MAVIELELDARAFHRSLRLTESQLKAAMAKAINRTIFEIRERMARRYSFRGSASRSPV